MSRLRLFLHGPVSGLLGGAMAGVADAVTTHHPFLDRSFLGISILAWVVTGGIGGTLAGAFAAALAEPARSRGARAPARLAALLATGTLCGAAAFQLLVWVNVSLLASDTGRQALLADAAILGGAAILALVGALALEPFFRDRSPAQTQARPAMGPGRFAGLLTLLVVLVASIGWRGGVGAVGPPASDPPDDSPNVVLILIDTLRRDHLSGEGYSRETSPALDAFASRGARFSSLVSTSCYTKPSVASLLTSLYPSGHRVGHLRTVLSEDRTTLAEAFHAVGWRTAKFVSNTIIGPEFGFAQGTERFVTLPTELVPKTKLGYALFRLTEPGRELPGFVQLAALLRKMERSLVGGHGAGVLAMRAPDVIASFEEWRDSIDGDPYFAYLHFMEPHAPYRPPASEAARFAADHEPFVDEHPPTIGLFLPFSQAGRLPDAERNGLIRAYDAEIAGLDRLLGEFLDRLAREDRASGRRTIVAITSDHGEEFYEHGGWGHGQSLYGEQLRIPFLIAGADVLPGLQVDQPALIVDIGPTLLELAGAPVPAALGGRSLAGLLVQDDAGRDPGRGRDAGSGFGDGEPRDELAEIVYGDAYWARALRSGRWKLIVAHLGEQERVQLFDVEVDPEEARDLAADRPDLVATMRERLEMRVAEAAAAGGDGAVDTAEFDPVTAERLRALGYVE